VERVVFVVSCELRIGGTVGGNAAKSSVIKAPSSVRGIHLGNEDVIEGYKKLTGTAVLAQERNVVSLNWRTKKKLNESWAEEDETGIPSSKGGRHKEVSAKTPDGGRKGDGVLPVTPRTKICNRAGARSKNKEAALQSGGNLQMRGGGDAKIVVRGRKKIQIRQRPRDIVRVKR